MVKSVSYGENKHFDNLKLPVTWAVLAIVAVICAIAAILLLGDRRESPQESGGGVRQAFDSATKPASGVLAAPVHAVGDGTNFIDDYMFAVRENRALKKKVTELEQYRDRYTQQKELNERYEKLLGLRTEPQIDMVTARSVTVTRGPFNRNRLIDAGTSQGVAFGYPVMTEHGLIGRVVSVGPNVSRVMMVSDVVSHVPVMVMRTDARAMMNGDGGPYPKLDFVRGQDAIKEGDQILTSGDGGIFPRGLPVGFARKGVDGWRVQLYANRTPVDFVKVLKYKDFSQLPEADAVLISPNVTTVLPKPLPPAAASATSSSAAAPAVSGSTSSATASRARAPAPAQRTASSAASSTQ